MTAILERQADMAAAFPTLDTGRSATGCEQVIPFVSACRIFDDTTVLACGTSRTHLPASGSAADLRQCHQQDDHGKCGAAALVRPWRQDLRTCSEPLTGAVDPQGRRCGSATSASSLPGAAQSIRDLALASHVVMDIARAACSSDGSRSGGSPFRASRARICT